MKEHTQTRRIPLTAVFSALTALLIAVVLLPFMKPQKAEAATTYQLWIMGTQVTSTNENDITGGSTAAKFTFDHNTNTVHVTARGNTSPVLYVESGMDAPAIFRSYLNDVTLSIDCKNIKFVSKNGDVPPIYVYNGNLTITGDGKLEIDSVTSCMDVKSFKADHANISLKGTIGIDNYGDYTCNISFISSTITADLSDYFIDNYLEYKYNWCYEPEFDDCHISDPANGYLSFDFGSYLPSYDTKTRKYYVKNSNGIRMNDFTISPDAPPAEVYEGIKICGQEVTSANKDDILGGGEFSYDPDNKTLYIKKTFNKLFSGNPTVIDNTGIDGLTINTTVSGCQIYNVDDGVSNPCINISKNTTFTGNNLSVYGDVYGIKVNGSAKLTMDSSVYVYADDYGIFGSSSASLILNKADISAKSSNNIAAVKGFKTITIPDSVTLKDMVYYISNGIRKGKTSSSPYAASISTVTNVKYDLWINGTQIRTSNQYNILGDGNGTFGSGAMYFSPGSIANCLVLNANGRTLNINSITSSMRNFYVVVMSDTTLHPDYPKSTQITFKTDTNIQGNGKLTVNNITATNCNLTIEDMDDLQIGEDGIDGSSFIAINGTGDITIEKSNVYVNKALRADKGYINLHSCYLAGPQDAVIKSYQKSSTNIVTNAVCLGESLAHGVRICKDGTKPKFTNNSMTLGGSISLNFYADLSTLPSTRYADSYVEFEVCGKKQTAKFDPNKMNSTKTTYGFTCMLDAVSMADPVKATLYYYDNYGGLNSITTTATAESYLEKFNANDPAKLWQLIKSVNDYGYYMQRYLCKHSGSPWTLGVDHVAMKKAYIVASELKSYKSTYASELSAYKKVYNYNTDIQKVNYSLALDADTSLIFKIKPANSYKGKVTVTVDGKAATATKLSDGRYQITINNIAAHQLGDKHTIAIKTTKGTSIFEASALSYAYECVTDPTDDSELLAMSALYRYYLAAINYKS